MSKISERIAKLPPNRQALLARLLKQSQIDLSREVIMPRARESNEAPLSFAQQRLWVFLQLDPDDASYNVPQVYRLKGPLNIKALTQSFTGIVRRHEALRTTFQIVSGEPRQVIGPPEPIAMDVVDLSQLPRAKRDATAQRLINDEPLQPFDLTHAPLLRVKLLKLEDTDHILLMTLHHIVSDGWSFGVLLHEITTLYNAFNLGQSSPLPELPIQYADFAI